MSTPLPTASPANSTAAGHSAELALTALTLPPVPGQENKADREVEHIVVNKIQQALQICIARKKYYEQAIEHYKKAPFSEIINYYKKHYLLSQIKHPEKVYRTNLNDIFTARISAYDFIIKFLERFSIDEAYLYARIEAFLQDYNLREKKVRKKEKKKLQLTEKSEKSENFFLIDIMNLLRPYVSQELDAMLKKELIIFTPRLGVGKDFLLLGRQEIIAPHANLINTFDTTIIEETGICLLGDIRGKYFTKTQIPLLDALKQQASKKNSDSSKKMEFYEEYDTNILVQQIMEYRELYIKIRQIMKPIRDRHKSMLIELEYANEYNKIMEQVEAINNLFVASANKYLLAKKEDLRNGTGSKNKQNDLLDQIDQKLIQVKIRSTKLFSELEKLALFVADLFFGNTSTDRTFMETVRYHLYELNQLKEALKTEAQLYSELMQARAQVQKDAEALVTAAANPPASKEPSKPNGNTENFKAEPKPGSKKEDKPKVTLKTNDKTLTKEEWLLKVEEGRKQRLLEKKQKMQTFAAFAINEARANNLLKKMRMLSEQEIKRREERIKIMGLSDNIKKCFEKLYTYQFCHDDLVNLIRVLKENGEAIELSYPSGGSAHYTIKIGLVLGYYEEQDEEESNSASSTPATAATGAAGAGAGNTAAKTTVVETGKAFTPHKNKALKNSKCFAKFIIENIQSVFWRAGYTPHALGLKLSEEFYFPKKFRL